MARQRFIPPRAPPKFLQPPVPPRISAGGISQPPPPPTLMPLTPPARRQIMPTTPLTINVPQPPTLNNLKAGAAPNPLALPQIPPPPSLNVPTLPKFGGALPASNTIGNQMKSMLGQGLAREVGYASGLVQRPASALTIDEQVAKDKALQDAKIAAGLINPLKPPAEKPPFEDPILTSPAKWLPVSPEGVKTYFDHAGHPIDDATAQAFYDASKVQANQDNFFKDLPKQWDNYIALKQQGEAAKAPTLFQDQARVGAMQDTATSDYERALSKEDAKQSAFNKGGAIPPPPGSAPQQPEFDPQTLAAATDSVGGKVDATTNPTDYQQIQAAVMPVIGPVLQTLGTFGQSQMTREAAMGAQDFFQWLGDKNVPILSQGAKAGETVANLIAGHETRIPEIAKIMGVSEPEVKNIMATAAQSRPSGLVGPMMGEQSAADVAAAAAKLGQIPARSGGLGIGSFKISSPKVTALLFAMSVIDTADKNGIKIPLGISDTLTAGMDKLGSVANVVLDPIQKQMNRAAMQQYLKSIDSENPDTLANQQRMADPRDPVQQAFNRLTGAQVAVNPSQIPMVRGAPGQAFDPNSGPNGPYRTLTPMEKRAAYTPITPFVPNQDPTAVNYLDAMDQAWREKNPLQAGVTDLAQWGILAETSGGILGGMKIAGDLAKAKAETTDTTSNDGNGPDGGAPASPRDVPPGPPTGPETAAEAELPRSPTDGAEISPEDLTKVQDAQQAVWDTKVAAARDATPEADAAAQKAESDLSNLLMMPPYRVTDPDLINAAQEGQPIFDSGYQSSLPSGTKRIVRTTPAAAGTPSGAPAVTPEPPTVPIPPPEAAPAAAEATPPEQGPSPVVPQPPVAEAPAPEQTTPLVRQPRQVTQPPQQATTQAPTSPEVASDALGDAWAQKNPNDAPMIAGANLANILNRFKNGESGTRRITTEGRSPEDIAGVIAYRNKLLRPYGLRQVPNEGDFLGNKQTYRIERIPGAAPEMTPPAPVAEPTLAPEVAPSTTEWATTDAEVTSPTAPPTSSWRAGEIPPMATSDAMGNQLVPPPSGASPDPMPVDTEFFARQNREQIQRLARNGVISADNQTFVPENTPGLTYGQRWQLAWWKQAQKDWQTQNGRTPPTEPTAPPVDELGLRGPQERFTMPEAVIPADEGLPTPRFSGEDPAALSGDAVFPPTREGMPPMPAEDATLRTETPPEPVAPPTSEPAVSSGRIPVDNAYIADIGQDNQRGLAASNLFVVDDAGRTFWKSPNESGLTELQSERLKFWTQDQRDWQDRQRVTGADGKTVPPDVSRQRPVGEPTTSETTAAATPPPTVAPETRPATARERAFAQQYANRPDYTVLNDKVYRVDASQDAIRQMLPGQGGSLRSDTYINDVTKRAVWEEYRRQYPESLKAADRAAYDSLVRDARANGVPVFNPMDPTDVAERAARFARDEPRLTQAIQNQFPARMANYPLDVYSTVMDSSIGASADWNAIKIKTLQDLGWNLVSREPTRFGQEIYNFQRRDTLKSSGTPEGTPNGNEPTTPAAGPESPGGRTEPPTAGDGTPAARPPEPGPKPSSESAKPEPSGRIESGPAGPIVDERGVPLPADQASLEGLPPSRLPDRGQGRPDGQDRTGGRPGNAPDGGEPQASGDRTGDGVRRSDAGDRATPVVPAARSATTTRDISLFSIADDLAARGPAARIDDNLNALDLLLKLRDDNRMATADEQMVLARYAGWGDTQYEYLFNPNKYVSGATDRLRRERFTKIMEALPSDEQNAIRASRRTAFYTTPPLVKAIYDGVRQLGAGKLNLLRVLEPSAGSGNFFGLMPNDLLTKSARTGVELDPVTGDILRHLYQNADVQITGFQDALLANNSFDLAISNVPFMADSLTDRTPEYMGQSNAFKVQSLHTYFMVKAMDKIRPGGVQAFIITSSAMDAPGHASVRNYLSKQADLVGAFRLPRNIFPDTAVGTDILFFRKRLSDETPGDSAWVNSTPVNFDYNGNAVLTPTDLKGKPKKGAHTLNQYFLDNPENVIGSQAMGRGSYSENEYGVTRRYQEDPIAVLNERIAATLPKNVMRDPVRRETFAYPPTIVSETKEGAFVIKDKNLLVRRGDQLVDPGLGDEGVRKVTQMVEIKNAARQVLQDQNEGVDDTRLQESQQNLRTAYDRYVRKYGPLNNAANRRLMKTDPDASFIRSLENWDDTTAKDMTEKYKVGEGEKPKGVDAADAKRLQGPMLTRRVVKAGIKNDFIPDAKGALLASLQERNGVDLPRMAELSGKSEEQLLNELGPLVYKNPSGSYEQAETYLSGNVRQKLVEAQQAAAIDPKYQDNVAALQAVQPRDVPYSEIDTRLGAQWIPTQTVNQFIQEIFGLPKRDETPEYVGYNSGTADWSQKVKNIEFRSAEAISKYRFQEVKYTDPIDKAVRTFGGYSDSEMLDFALNDVKPIVRVRVTKLDKNGDPYEASAVSGPLTAQARTKVADLRSAFQDWIWKDPERAKALSSLYNERFNAFVETKWDGSHLSLPGSNPEISLMPHQLAAVWRILQGGNVMLAHEVGFGKTYIMQAAGMEARRLGLAKKNVYIMPNHLVENFVQKFQQLYPNASLLVPELGAGPESRTLLTSQIATGDWDGIILPESQAGLIPVSPARTKKYLNDQVNELRIYHQQAEAAERAADNTGRSRPSKRLQAEIDKVVEKIKKIDAQLAQRQDNTLYWEDLGVDQIFVDEADRFKNMYFMSRMPPVKGFSRTYNEKTQDMYLKIQHTTEKNNGRGVIFATGTPVSNTIAELWTMMRYLMPKKLDELGLQNFDSWRSQFATTSTRIGQTVTGAYAPVERFDTFTNAPELSKIFKMVADVKMSEDSPELEKLKPRLKEGKRIVVGVESDPTMKAFMDTLGPRAEAVKKKPQPELGGDNMLTITDDGKKAAVDLSMVIKGAPDNPQGKLAKVAENVYNIWKQETADKGAQAIFLDFGMPRTAKQIMASRETKVKEARKSGRHTEAEIQAAYPKIDEATAQEIATRTNLYGKLKTKLMAMGIPESEIAYIHDAKNNVQADQIFKKVNRGEIRVLIGSTEKMGAGSNFQTRLAALHRIDAPWRPRDIEQSEGRILRQGNDVYGPKYIRDKATGKVEVTDPGRGVNLYTYVTKNSLDGYIWDVISSKQRAIKSLIRGDDSVRSVEDSDELVLSAGEMSAIVSGEPIIFDRIQAQGKLQEKEGQRAAASDAQISARATIQQENQSVKSAQRQIEKIAPHVAAIEKNPKASPFTLDKGFINRKEDVVVTPQELKSVNTLLPERLKPLMKDAPISDGTSNTEARIIPMGMYRGFQISFRPMKSISSTKELLETGRFFITHESSKMPSSFMQAVVSGVPFEMTENFTLPEVEAGNLDFVTRINNAIEGFKKEQSISQEKIAEAQRNIAGAEFTLKQGAYTGGPIIQSIQNAIAKIESHLENREPLTDEQKNQLRADLQKLYKDEYVKIDPPTQRIEGLGANDEVVDTQAPDNGDAASPDDLTSDSNITQLNAGFDPRPFIKKYPLLATGIIGAGVFAVIGAPQEAEDRRTGKDSLAGIEFVPAVKQILDAGQAQGLKFSLGQVIKGLNTYNNEYLPVEAELAATVAEIPFSMASKALGATPENVKPGFFDVNQPAYLQGFNWTADNATVKLLQDRWQKRTDRNPTLAFLTTLVADPMNWVGWGEAEDSARTAKVLSDMETAQNPVSKASGTFFTKLSRGAIAKQREQDFARMFYNEAGTVDADPTAVMERIDQAIRQNKATDAQMRLAQLWGDQKEVNQDAVRRLQKYMGILDPKDLSPEEISAISDRVQGKARWTQEDIRWLDKTFDYPTPPMGRRLVKQYQNLQVWAAEHGVPDLTTAIDKSQGADVREWMKQTMYKVREKYPPEQSPLTAWMEERPMTHRLLAAGRVLQPGLDALNKHVGLPLVLAYLASPGWPLHAATELALRGMLGPQSAVTGIRNLGQTVKALAGGYGGGNALERVVRTPWWHEQDAARKVYGHWYPPDLLEGRGGFATMPLTNNPLKRSPIPILGGGINKGVADAMRQLGKPANAQPGLDALAAVRKEYTAASAEGRAVNQDLIKSLAGPKPTTGMQKAYQGLTNVVEHANFGSLYGANQYLVGKMEGAMRTYYIAQEHERIFPTVLKMLGVDAQKAQSLLQKIAGTRPPGVSDATWARVNSAVQGVLTKGGVQDVVENTLRGQIDRLNLAKTIFSLPGIPYPVQAEWFMAMRHWTPEDLQAYFAEGGAAEKVLQAGLDFMYGNRLKPLIQEIMARQFDWNTVAGRRDGWKALEAELETNITANRDIWTWAKAIAPTMAPEERGAMYNEVRRIRQQWLTRQRVEQNQARRMFENSVRRERGFATVPDRVFEMQDRQFGELMKTYDQSDSLMASYWADEASKGRGDPVKWKQMRQQQDALWKEYRDNRNAFENEKNQVMEDFYARTREANAVPTSVVSIPGLRDVTPEQRAMAQADLQRARSYLGGYTQRASVLGKEADALRSWAQQVDEQIKTLPPDALAQIDKAHEATARMVTENMRSRFVDHLNQTELDSFMHKFLPFWMYDTHGGAFYLWMAGHVPGVYTTADRFINQTQGTGYLQGGMNPLGQNVTSGVIPSEDFGVFGNQVNPFRGMWPNRFLTFAKQLQASRPATATEAMTNVFKDLGQQGILGAHMHPLIEAPLQLAQGQGVGSIMPPALNQVSDLGAIAGQGFGPLRSQDQFLDYHVQEELFAKGVDPQNATPQQKKDAEHAVGVRDFFGSLVPRFTYTTPEKLQERADFQDALAAQGFSKKDQADMIRQGFSPWSLLDSQQKRTLMHDHPDWQYLFEANDAFKTPEEKVAAQQVRTYLNNLTDITAQRYTVQIGDDQALKSGAITPREWMDQHTKHNDFTAGERSRLGKMLAGAKANLDDPTRRRLLTPEDQAVSDYYAKQAQWIKDNTSQKGGPGSPLNVVDWSAVNDQEKQYLGGLNPQIAQYVQQEITKNQTETEKMWHQALDELDQYNQIPRWIGITPDQAQQRVQQEATYTRLAATDPRAAAIYRATHALLTRRLPRNPARDQFVMQHPVLEAWFVPPTAKKMALTGNELNRDAFGSLVSVPWEDSPGAGGPPAQTSTLDLAEAGA